MKFFNTTFTYIVGIVFNKIACESAKFRIMALEPVGLDKFAPKINATFFMFVRFILIMVLRLLAITKCNLR